VYFITSRVRDGVHAFASDRAKEVFFDRFDYYTRKYNFVSWIETLMINHYHFLGYLKDGENLGPLMQHLHGSVAKLVNDLLPQHHLPFWRTRGNKDYFDGCLRDPLQCRRAFRYTKLQAVRAGIVTNHRNYPFTRIHIDCERGIARALELRAYLQDVPYHRYDRRRRRSS
jgi:hypothetical protein